MNINTDVNAIATGDIVWGRPVREGKASARRKGIVLGQSLAGAGTVVVWWYGEGAASDETTTIAYNAELTLAGDIWYLGSRQARKLVKACGLFRRAAAVRSYLDGHAVRMAKAGL